MVEPVEAAGDLRLVGVDFVSLSCQAPESAGL